MRLHRVEIFLIVVLLVLGTCIEYGHAYRSSSVSENNQAVEFLEQGDFAAGIDLLKQAVQRSPDDPTIRRNLANAYLSGGRAYLQQQRFHDLVSLMDEALDFSGDQSRLRSMRGYGLFQLKEYEGAEDDLQSVRDQGAADGNTLFLLGLIFYQSDRMFEARDVLEEALLLDPEAAAVRELLDKIHRETTIEQGMDKEYGGHFVVTFDGETNSGLGRQVMAVLDDAYYWVGMQLGHYPEQKVPVILYSRQQFLDLTDSPDWAGGLYDGKIRLPVGGITEVNQVVRGLLYHEYMHVALRDLTGNRLPYWLNEGLAEVAERSQISSPFNALAQAVSQDIRFSLDDLEGSFKRFQGAQVSLAYEQSYAFVQFLIDDFGWLAVRELMTNIDKASSVPEAIESTFGIYGFNYRTLQERWRALTLF